MSQIIPDELYNKIKTNALKNKSRSSIIYLQLYDSPMRRYKVNLDEDNDLYIMYKGEPIFILSEDASDSSVSNFIIDNQIAYIKDELDAEKREFWNELLNNDKGLKMWVDVQYKIREKAKTVLQLNIKSYKLEKNPRVKSCMNLLISIIKYDIDNVKKNFEIYKDKYTDDIMDAEDKSKNNSFHIRSINNSNIKLSNDAAYLKYCATARDQITAITGLVDRVYLDPRGPPPELWN